MQGSHPRASHRPALVIIFLALAGLLPGVADRAFALDMQATIDFDVENLPEGTILDQVYATGGENDLIGPIGISGHYPGRPGNSAVIFDSAMRTGGDGDLGTPNQTFGGPGIGLGGEIGEPYANDTALEHILIVAEDLVDYDGDGLVDDPDDGAIPGMIVTFDFSTITAPFVPQNVSVLALTVIDTEGYNPGQVKIYDAGGALISSTPLVSVGDNGVATQWLGAPGLGISGAATMKVHLNGSSAVDDIVLELTSPPPPSCDLSSPGSDHEDLEVGEAWSLTIQASTDLGSSNLTLDTLTLPAGAFTTSALPASSGGSSSIEVELYWTPTADQVGHHLLTFVATDAIGQVSACSIGVQVHCHLSIPTYQQPSSQTVCAGESVYFSASPHVTHPATYEWRKDGVAIPGANSTSLSLTAVSSSDAGDYTLVITNPCGELSSHTATLTVKDAPSITTQPSSTSACHGGSATFSVTASGSETLSYQWKKDGTPISGATSSSYTISSVSDSDAGAYTVKITNDCGSKTSDAAPLHVRHAPTIYGHPEARTLCAGESTTFSVTATGSDPLSYQWKKDGVEIPGATGTSFTLSSVSPSDEGVYIVVASNDCGSAECAGGMLSVRTPPSIDSHPSDQTLCEGETLSLSVSASGSESLYYTWKKDGVTISGATSSSYTVTSASSSDSGVYTVRVENDCGDEVSYPANVEVRKAPSIATQPYDQTLCEGEALYLSVEAYGSHPLSYQWKKDGAAIPGANAASYSVASASESDSGSYTVRVENDCGYEVSYPANVEVRVAPQINQHPMDQVLCEGETLTLSVEVYGSHPLSYQWKKDGIAISGATASTFTVMSASSSDSGTYTVRIENDCGHATSDPANVEVRVAPEFTQHPMGQTLCEGDPLLLSVTATGSHPLSYQWSLDGAPIPGATESTYMIASVSTSDAGTYTVHVENDCGSKTSDPAEVVVRVAPMITQQPKDQTLCEGETITLAVTATGSDPLSYQWKKDGVDISAATNPSAATAMLTIPDALASDSGSYSVTVTNDCGSATSNAAAVEVRVAPAITTQPVGDVLCEGEMLTLTVVATGSAPLAYQWTKDGIDIPIATNPSAATATFSIASSVAADSGTYTVTVSNDCGSITSDGAPVEVRVAPTITVDPVGATLCEGEMLALTVTATGSAPLLYQWKKDGIDISAATNPSAATATFTIASVLEGDSGLYTVTVMNDCGTAMSAGASVTVRVAPTITVQPQDQLLCEGETISLSVTATGSAPLEYQWQKDGIDISAATNPSAATSMLMIPAALAADSGVYTVSISNDCGSETSAGANVTVRVAPVITTQPVGQTLCTGETLTLTVVATGTEPLTYQWQKDGIAIPAATNPSAATATLMIPTVATTDAGSYTVVVSNVCDTVTSAPAVVVIETPPVITVQPQSQSICLGEPVTFSVTATGSTPITYQWRKDGIDIPGATLSSFTIGAVTLADAAVYSVVVSNICDTVTSNGATLTVLEPPTITTQPQGGEVCLGENFTLTVTATGSAPLSYQWRRNGVAIPGATAASLTLTSVTLADGGTYTVLVSNICDQVESAGAVVTILSPPTITAQPAGDTICVGDSLTLTVTATGSAPLTYQWFLDGAPIPGATQASFPITNATLADAGAYTVTVTNICDTVTSATATVVVAEAPTVTLTSPTAVTLCSGESTTLTTTVTGFAPITLSWSKDGTPIPGAGAATFTITNATPADAGTYQLTATNLCGTDQSPPITITVRVPPTITQQPVGDDEICPDEGNDFTFTVAATGSTPLSYQWFFDGAVIPGATQTSYTVVDVVLADYGTYTVEVENDCDTVTSSAAILAEPVPGFCETEFERGDCNADGLIDIADGIYIMRFSFQGFGPPSCFDACDHNDDGMVNIADTIHLISYIFLQGDVPPQPFGVCGLDETLDELDCPFFPPCDMQP